MTGSDDALAAARETADRGLRLDGTKWDGLYVGRCHGNDLVYAAKVGPRLRRRERQGIAGAPHPADPQEV
jgi:hypothetical protein